MSSKHNSSRSITPTAKTNTTTNNSTTDSTVPIKIKKKKQPDKSNSSTKSNSDSEIVQVRTSRSKTRSGVPLVETIMFPPTDTSTSDSPSGNSSEIIDKTGTNDEPINEKGGENINKENSSKITEPEVKIIKSTIESSTSTNLSTSNSDKISDQENKVIKSTSTSTSKKEKEDTITNKIQNIELKDNIDADDGNDDDDCDSESSDSAPKKSKSFKKKKKSKTKRNVKKKKRNHNKKHNHSESNSSSSSSSDSDSDSDSSHRHQRSHRSSRSKHLIVIPRTHFTKIIPIVKPTDHLKDSTAESFKNYKENILLLFKANGYQEYLTKSSEKLWLEESARYFNGRNGVTVYKEYKIFHAQLFAFITLSVKNVFKDITTIVQEIKQEFFNLNPTYESDDSHSPTCKDFKNGITRVYNYSGCFHEDNVFLLWHKICSRLDSTKSSLFTIDTKLTSFMDTKWGMNENPSDFKQRWYSNKAVLNALKAHDVPKEDEFFGEEVLKCLLLKCFGSFPGRDTLKQQIHQSDDCSVDQIFDWAQRVYNEKASKSLTTSNSNNSTTNKGRTERANFAGTSNQDYKSQQWVPHSSSEATLLALHAANQYANGNGGATALVANNNYKGRGGKNKNKNFKSGGNSNRQPMEEHFNVFAGETSLLPGYLSDDSSGSDREYNYFTTHSKKYLNAELDLSLCVIIDTGATRHCVWTTKFLVDIITLKVPFKISSLHGSGSTVKQCGTLNLTSNVSIGNVNIVPNSRVNLISVSELVRAGCNFNIVEGAIDVVHVKSGRRILTFHPYRGLWIMKLDHATDKDTLADRNEEATELTIKPKSRTNGIFDTGENISSTGQSTSTSSSNSTSTSKPKPISSKPIRKIPKIVTPTPSTRPPSTRTSSTTTSTTSSSKANVAIDNSFDGYDSQLEYQNDSAYLSYAPVNDVPSILNVMGHEDDNGGGVDNEYGLASTISTISGDAIKNTEHDLHLIFNHAPITREFLKNAGVTVPVGGYTGGGLSCNVCEITNMKRHYRGGTHIKPTANFEKVGCDLIGPFSVVQGGNRIKCRTFGTNAYALVMVDHVSRYTFCSLLVHKSEATDKMIDTLTLIKNKFGVTVKNLHSDGGLEFINKKVSNYCTSNGITQTFTTTDTPHLNGTVERMNGKLVGIVKSMLAQCNGTFSLWGEALVHAVKVHNCTPLAAIGFKSPHQLVTGTPYSNPDKFKVFGSDVYYLPVSGTVGKFQKNGIAGIYVGISEKQCESIRVLIRGNTVIATNDVKINASTYSHIQEFGYGSDNLVLPVTDDEAGSPIDDDVCETESQYIDLDELEFNIVNGITPSYSTSSTYVPVVPVDGTAQMSIDPNNTTNTSIHNDFSEDVSNFEPLISSHTDEELEEKYNDSNSISTNSTSIPAGGETIDGGDTSEEDTNLSTIIEETQSDVSNYDSDFPSLSTTPQLRRSGRTIVSKTDHHGRIDWRDLGSASRKQLLNVGNVMVHHKTSGTLPSTNYKIKHSLPSNNYKIKNVNQQQRECTSKSKVPVIKVPVKKYIQYSSPTINSVNTYACLNDNIDDSIAGTYTNSTSDTKTVRPTYTKLNTSMKLKNSLSNLGKTRDMSITVNSVDPDEDAYTYAAVHEQVLPKTYKQAVRSRDASLWLAAIKKEADSLFENEVFTIVRKPKGVLLMGTRWVFAIKYGSTGEVLKFKARTVAKGYEQRAGIDYFDTYSPVARFTTMRLTLALAAIHNMEVKQIDFCTAFLNAKLNEEIYIGIPEGIHTDGSVNPKTHCIKLNRALYGLKQSPLEWYKLLHSVLVELGYTSTSSDPCCYFKYVAGTSLPIIVTVYVDDVIIAYDKSLAHIWLADKAAIQSKYAIEDMDDINFCLKMKIDRDRSAGTITISQAAYVQSLLDEYKLNEQTPADNPCLSVDLTEVNLNDPGGEVPVTVDGPVHTLYRSMVGSLMYLANTTRIDICYAVHFLARFVHAPLVKHLKAARHIFRYLKKHPDYRLVYTGNGSVGGITQPIVTTSNDIHSTSTVNVDGTNEEHYTTHGVADRFQLTAFCDADWAGDSVSRCSTQGSIVTLNGNVVAWQCQKQKSVSLSSTEAEYVGINLAAREIVWFQSLLHDIFDCHLTPTIFTDNRAAKEWVTSESIKHKVAKHIDARYKYVRQLEHEKVIRIGWKSTLLMLADVLTKNLTKVKFSCFRDQLLGNGVNYIHSKIKNGTTSKVVKNVPLGNED